MKKNLFKFKHGFTVIEVSLVIAIAGLIFLMVFVALPGLRASQRDSQRRDDMLNFITTVKKYQTNNRGALPVTPDSGAEATYGGTGSSSWQNFYNEYLDHFMDPDGEYYKLEVINCTGTEAGEDCPNGDLEEEDFGSYTVLVVTKAKCYGSKAVRAANPRNLAVIYRLEGSGTFCTSTSS